MTIVHRHMLYYAEVGSEKREDELEHMLEELVERLDMTILIPPQLAFSQQRAWTGIVGITTSHISFHYWQREEYVQMDIYSCKPYDRDAAVAYLNRFWKARNEKFLFIDRDKQFRIESSERS